MWGFVLLEDQKKGQLNLLKNAFRIDLKFSPVGKAEEFFFNNKLERNA